MVCFSYIGSKQEMDGLETEYLNSTFTLLAPVATEGELRPVKKAKTYHEKTDDKENKEVPKGVGNGRQRSKGGTTKVVAK